MSAVDIIEYDDEDGVITERGFQNGSTVLGKLDNKSDGQDDEECNPSDLS